MNCPVWKSGCVRCSSPAAESNETHSGKLPNTCWSRLGEIDFGQFADDDDIARRDALEILAALEGRVERIVFPMLGDEDDRIRLRADGLVERLRERLAEI